MIARAAAKSATHRLTRARIEWCCTPIRRNVNFIWGVFPMLLRLSEHIRACYERSARAEEQAIIDPGFKSHHLETAQRWAHLARSFEFVESLERFLLDLDRFFAAKRDLWQPIATAPCDRDLRLAVLEANGVAHPLVFPTRRILGGWIKTETKERIQLDPTHWQDWS